MTNIEAITNAATWPELSAELDSAYPAYLEADDAALEGGIEARYWAVIEAITNKRADTPEGHRIKAKAIRRVWIVTLDDERDSAYGRLWHSQLEDLDPKGAQLAA